MSTDPITGTSSSAATDSTPASASGASGSASLGKDVFLQLLVTQLKNQDPLQPQDNSAFLAQLAQFSSLEELQQIDSNTTALVGGLQGATTGAGSTTPQTSTSATQGSN